MTKKAKSRYPIPETVYLGEYAFRVRDEAVLLAETGKPLCGMIDWEQEVIKLDLAAHSTDRSRFGTLLHECNHAIWARSLGGQVATLIGLLQPRADRIEDVMGAIEEAFADHVLAGLVELMARNPTLLGGFVNLCQQRQEKISHG